MARSVSPERGTVAASSAAAAAPRRARPSAARMRAARARGEGARSSPRDRAQKARLPAEVPAPAAKHGARYGHRAGARSSTRAASVRMRAWLHERRPPTHRAPPDGGDVPQPPIASRGGVHVLRRQPAASRSEIVRAKACPAEVVRSSSRGKCSSGRPLLRSRSTPTPAARLAGAAWTPAARSTSLAATPTETNRVPTRGVGAVERISLAPQRMCHPARGGTSAVRQGSGRGRQIGEGARPSRVVHSTITDIGAQYRRSRRAAANAGAIDGTGFPYQEVMLAR